ncbi:MAG: zinc ABC transporter substrate-binding protein, partial [Methanolinea sp.]|nr:zinc ABC transporter substrate-binding protein [Methanolinea sp.]
MNLRERLWPLTLRMVAATGLLLIVLGIAGCTDIPEKTGRAPLEVAVTLLPQAEIVNAVGGERVCVTVVVPPGGDPHTYEPAAGQMVTLSQAGVYFRLGPGLLPFEDTLVDRIRVMNPEIVVVDMSEGIPRLSGDGEGEGYDPHIWLSLTNAEKILENTRKGFVLADPSFAEYYTGREQQYKDKIREADTSIRVTLAGKQGAAFVVTHPAWGYFARDYGLVQIAVESEGKEPSAREISTLIDRARAE